MSRSGSYVIPGRAWRAFLVIVMLLAAAGAPEAQPADRTARIAFLSATAFIPGLVQEFEEALREAGWDNGKNLVIEYRSAQGRYDRLPALAEEVVRLQPRVIVTGQTPSTQALQKVTDTIPIVMLGHGDPVRYGVVKDLARPEGNVTGTAFLVNEVGIKSLELLKQAVPSAVRVAIFVNPDNPGSEPFLTAAREAAPRLGLTVRSVEITSPTELSRLLETVARESVDAFLVTPEALIISKRQQILDFALSHRLPSVGLHPAFTASGALISYSPHFPSMLRASARYVDRLLKGARPQDLSIEQPSRFELIINAKTAKTLGLTLPPALLLRADRMVE